MIVSQGFGLLTPRWKERRGHDCNNRFIEWPGKRSRTSGKPYPSPPKTHSGVVNGCDQHQECARNDKATAGASQRAAPWFHAGSAVAGFRRSASRYPADGRRRARSTGGVAVSGNNARSVNQSSTNAIIDWSSFSISQGASVTFNNGSGATLNRVQSGGPVSTIDGRLSATGSVYLINPSGMIIGKDGVDDQLTARVTASFDFAHALISAAATHRGGNRLEARVTVGF